MYLMYAREKPVVDAGSNFVKTAATPPTDKLLYP